MHPAVLYQLAYVIRVCKRAKVQTSICGQAGSRKEMAKYLVENGIDSISVNADVAKEISDYVAEIEKSLVEGTDEEPRKYQPEPKKEFKPEVTVNSGAKNIEMPMKFNPGTQQFQPNTEKLNEDIQKIEEEKQEYLQTHPEEDNEIPQINGAENLNNKKTKEIVKDSDEAIKKIEEEKQEYLQNKNKDLDIF
jgi:hypothetical protein